MFNGLLVHQSIRFRAEETVFHRSRRGREPASASWVACCRMEKGFQSLTLPAKER